MASPGRGRPSWVSKSPDVNAFDREKTKAGLIQDVLTSAPLPPAHSTHLVEKEASIVGSPYKKEKEMFSQKASTGKGPLCRHRREKGQAAQRGKAARD